MYESSLTLVMMSSLACECNRCILRHYASLGTVVA